MRRHNRTIHPVAPHLLGELLDGTISVVTQSLVTYSKRPTAGFRMMHSKVSDEPVAALTRHRLTVDEYHRMGEAGIFGEDDRVELIDGELIDMTPIGSRHAYVVDLINRLFTKEASQDRLVRVQNPIQLGEYGEPEPDLAVVRNAAYFDRHPQAADVLLIIEVSETSLNYDKSIKVPYYARYEIPEVWIIDLDGKRITVNRKPLSNGSMYESITACSKGFLVSERIPEVELKVDDLWA